MAMTAIRPHDNPITDKFMMAFEPAVSGPLGRAVTVKEEDAESMRKFTLKFHGSPRRAVLFPEDVPVHLANIHSCLQLCLAYGPL
jgi:hypothetical protein